MPTMITHKQLDEWRTALHNFVVMSDENDNIEKKRTGVLSIKTEIEQDCPFVKHYKPYPDFGILNYTTSLCLYQGHVYEIERFVSNEYDKIKEYENLDQETIAEYAAKLEHYKQAESVHYTDRIGPHPDQIFTQHGSYRKFRSYQTDETYALALKLRKALEKTGEGDFDLHFKVLMLYNAASNDLAKIEKTMRRMGYVIADTTVESRDEIQKSDPYVDVKPFRNPEADPYIYYNFWGTSLKKKQEQYQGKSTLTGEQMATFLAHYNLRKFEFELERIFQSARAEVYAKIPETTKKELEKLLSKLLDDYILRVGRDFGTTFDIMAERLASWENRTKSASNAVENKVPTIVCLDDESNGSCSSSCIERYIDVYCHEKVQDYLQKLAFSPGNHDIGILLYDFWGADYDGLVEQYRGKHGLPDNLRALFNKEDNTALFLNKVKDFLDDAIDECTKNGTRVGTREMSRTLAKTKAFFQDLFFKFNERLDDTDLSNEEKMNASLGWLYFSRRDVGRIRWTGITYTNPPVGMIDMRGLYFTFTYHGCGDIFDEMKRRFLEDSEVETPASTSHSLGLFSPNGNAPLKLDRLYEYLTREDERVIIISKADFEYAIYNADFNVIFKDAETLKSMTKVKCLIKLLKEHFTKSWYDAVSRNCGIAKTNLSNINFDRGTTKLFYRCIDGIPLT